MRKAGEFFPIFFIAYGAIMCYTNIVLTLEQRVDDMNILFFLTPKAEVAHVLETETLRQVIEKMEFHGYTAVPLLSSDGRYIGTITDGDLLWNLKRKNYPKEKDLETIKIIEIPRRRDNQAVRITETVENLFDKVFNQNFVPVEDDEGSFIGIVTRKDVLAYMGKRLKDKK